MEKNKNLFVGAKVGDKFLCRDGRVAFYCYQYDEREHCLFVEGDEELWYVRYDGLIYDFDDSFMDSSYYTDKDIISRYEMSIDKNKVDQLAIEYENKMYGYSVNLNDELETDFSNQQNIVDVHSAWVDGYNHRVNDENKLND